MTIEKLKNLIERLSKQEKQTILHIGELSEEELEKAIGGLSNQAIIALIILGAVGVAGIIKKSTDSNTKPIDRIQFLKQHGFSQTQIDWLEQND